MTEEIIIDKEEFWNMFEKHPVEAIEGLFTKIDRLQQENQALRRTIKDINIVAVCEELEKLKQENEYLRNQCNKCKQYGIEENNRKLLEENEALQAQLNNITVQSNNIITALEQENRELLEARNHFMAENLKYFNALEEILESAKFAQCLPCGSRNLEDCLNCSDETTNNGQFCMEKRIHEIKTKCVEVLGNETVS